MTQRDIIFLHCQDGHDWKLVGGKACCCDESRGWCSLPVHRCSRCGDYDYGDNDEAREIVAECQERNNNETC
jgi:hypothetical protein